MLWVRGGRRSGIRVADEEDIESILPDALAGTAVTPLRKIAFSSTEKVTETHMTIKTVGIIGAGTMGNGIAQACAVAGTDALMLDVNPVALDKGVTTISGSLDRLLKKENHRRAKSGCDVARQDHQHDGRSCQCDYVIEAATENEGLKIKILKDLDALLPAGTNHCDQHPSISITQLAAATKRP